MEISCKIQYALLALLELTAHYDRAEPLQIRQIATKQEIPDRYLEQLLAILRRRGLVRSQRGSRGGYLLAKEPHNITVWDVMQCLEGADGQIAAPTASPKTAEDAVIGEVWSEVDTAVNSILQKYTLKDLAERRDARQQLDIMYYI